MQRPLPVLAVGLAAGLGGPADAGAGPGFCEVEQIAGAFPEGINFFGRALAIRGGLVVVGMSVEKPDLEGTTHVYRVVTDGLVAQAALHSAVVACENSYGASMAMGGTVLAVGDDSEGTPDCGSGAVYVYRVDSGTPVFEQKLSASNGAAFDHFGGSVAVWGDTILVGSGHATNGVPYAGAAYIFRHANGSWTEEAILADPVPEQSAGFSRSMALSGDVAIVGAYLDNGPVNDTGAALVFRYADGQWTFEQELKPSDAAPFTSFHWFGASVALDGDADTAVIGAPHDLGQLGSAYVFEYDGSKWVESTKLQAEEVLGDYASFGGSVAISLDGQTILIGAAWDSAAGAAHLFRRIGDEWVEVDKFTRAGSTCLGSEVAIDGDLALVGDPCGQAGEVYLLAGMRGIDCNGNGEPDSCDIVTGSSQDADGNGIPDECAILGDLDGDGYVGIIDFLALLSSWGSCPQPCPPSCAADLDGDCAAGIADFLLLLGGWVSPPAPPACPRNGDCCDPHGSAGCDDPACCDAVCAADPFCCEAIWDAACVNGAQALCGCAPPKACAAGDCCAVAGLGGPGCGDPACCESICDFVDPFCCQVLWDGACALWAIQFCDCPPLVCSPDAGSCCFPNGGLGCNDLECCALVCEQIDPFCCEAAWDSICASIAGDVCKVCGA